MKVAVMLRHYGPLEQDAIRTLPGLIRKAIMNALVGPKGVKPLAQEAWTANGNIASGHLRNSPQGEVTHGPNVFIGWLGMADYWENVEYGTKPHWVPLTTPDGGGLLRWVRNKHLAGEDASKDGPPPSLTYRAVRMKNATAIGIVRRHAKLVERLNAMSPTWKTRRARLEQRIAGMREVTKVASMRLDMQRRADANVQRLKQVGITATNQEMLIAQAVQVAIARHGTRAYPAVEPATEIAGEELANQLDKIMGAV